MTPSTLVWDLPVRLFHWALAAGVIGAAAIALTLDDNHRLFPYHALIGLLLAMLVLLRILWGLVASRHARIGALLFPPSAVAAYFWDAAAGRPYRHAGHNPASAYAILAILALVLGLAATGFLMARGNDAAEEAHELMAYALLAVAGLHILGVILHTARYRDPIALSMIHGRKRVDPADGIASARPLAAAALVILTALWGSALLRGYDPAARSAHLPLLGAPLQIGDAPDREHAAPDARSRHHDDD